jgi:hypothetical protein
MPAQVLVMARHSRSKNGVVSTRLCPAIHVFACRKGSKTWMPATSAGMTVVCRKLVASSLQRKIALQFCRGLLAMTSREPFGRLLLRCTMLTFTTLLRGNGLSAAFSVKVRDA